MRYSPSDDGRVIDGKVVVFLQPRNGPLQAGRNGIGKGSRSERRNGSNGRDARASIDDGSRPADAAATKLLLDARWLRIDGKPLNGYAHLEKARLVVKAPGLDGRTVRFIIERSSIDAWAFYDVMTATVVGEKAVAQLRVPHPDANVPRHAGLRFHAEVLAGEGT
jgi:hypothetical protein